MDSGPSGNSDDLTGGLQGGERLPRRQVVLACGAHDQEWGRGRERHQERQPRQRGGVAPVQVVHDEQQRSVEVQHGSGQSLEEAQPLPGVDLGPRSAPWLEGGVAVGHQPLHLGTPDRVERGRGEPQVRVAQPLRHRGQRQARRGREAAGGRHHTVLSLDDPGDVAHQSRLADACLPGDEEEPAVLRGARPALQQDATFDVSTHQLQRPPARPRCSSRVVVAHGGT